MLYVGSEFMGAVILTVRDCPDKVLIGDDHSFFPF